MSVKYILQSPDLWTAIVVVICITFSISNILKAREDSLNFLKEEVLFQINTAELSPEEIY